MQIRLNQLALLCGIIVKAYSQDFLYNLEGHVSAEEFLYYKIVQSGNILLVLESPEGDTDIYISDKHRSPNYHPETYDLHSATCGTDTILIPKQMKRPIAVGIYGHSSHDLSKFSLSVFSMPDYIDHFENEQEILLPMQLRDNGEGNSEENSYNEPDDQREPKETQKIQVRQKKRSPISGILPILELFEMLFL